MRSDQGTEKRTHHFMSPTQFFFRFISIDASLYNRKQSPSGSLRAVVGRGPETASESSERVSQYEASLYVGLAYDQYLATASQLAKKTLDFSEELGMS